MIPYDEYGEKSSPTVLLLHGAAALDTFCQQYEFAGEYHLIVPHLYGAGKSASEVYEPEQLKKELLLLIKKLDSRKIGIIGHSLGAQLAIMLVCEAPEQFSFAVYLSAWVNPTQRSIRQYSRLAGITSSMLKWKWLVRLQGKYWNYTKEQSDYMAEYARDITAEIYRSFFTNTLRLSECCNYNSIKIPMLAICGSKEVNDMKKSLDLLGENPCCQTMILSKENHDFPMRAAKKLNPILLDFIERNISNE